MVLLRRFILACAGLLACVALAAGVPRAAAGQQATAAGKAAKTAEARRHAAIRWLGTRIDAYRRATWDWQRLMGTPPTRAARRTPAATSVEFAKWTLRLWKARAAKAQRKAQRPPHLQAFLCIHRYEGAWTDGGAPYYGGLQMDLGFQRAYGRHLLRTKGTADHWTPLEQIWTAEKAHRSRGFYPWPRTARACGLI